MAENKRLYDVIDKAEPRGQSVTYEGIPCTARTCVTRLNRLTEENKQLQKKNDNLVDMIARVQYRADLIKEENEQLKADKQALIEFIKKEFPKSHKHILEGFE